MLLAWDSEMASNSLNLALKLQMHACKSGFLTAHITYASTSTVWNRPELINKREGSQPAAFALASL